MEKKIINDVYEADDEALLLNPNDVTKRKRRQIVDEDNDVEIAKDIERTGNKYYNTGGKVAIEFETMGRFDTPSVMYFSDYTTQDVNDITLSRREDLLKNLVVILNRCKGEQCTTNVEDMLLEEMLEVLVGMKMEYTSVNHEHPWVCQCQSGIDGDAQTVNTEIINLSELKYKSIEDADEEMRTFYADVFKHLCESEYQKYLEIKYKKEIEENSKDISKITVEEELKKLKIIEPIGFKDDDGNVYSFNFVRVRDLLDATRLTSLKYAPKFKQLKNRQAPQNSPLLEFKTEKEKEIEDLQYQQGKDLLLYSKAFSLVKYNGKTLTKDESVSYYKKMPRSLLFRVNNFFEQIRFGVIDEKELECPLCGHVSKRLLRQEFNPFEFLPFETDPDDTKRRLAGSNIFIGI